MDNPPVRESGGELLLYLAALLTFVAMLVGFAGEQLLSAFVSGLALICILFGTLGVTSGKP